MRILGFCALVGLALLGLPGCNKSASPPEKSETSAEQAKPQAAVPVPGVDTIAQVHWVGKKRLSTQSNAVAFMAIWALPESARLEAQTLDKLALFPWLKSVTNHLSTITNYQALVAAHSTASLLRPMLDDLVQEECWVEMRRAGTNRQAETAIAIRLSSDRATLWQKQLAAVLESLAGIRAVPGPNGQGWSLKKHDYPNLVELTRAGDWTIVGLAQDTNQLVPEFVSRIQTSRAPFLARATNYWVEAEMDFPKLAAPLARCSHPSKIGQAFRCRSLAME